MGVSRSLALFKPQKASADSIPAGVIFDFGGSTLPVGYLPCDGSAVSRTTYSRLFAAVGTTWGTGNGTTTFNVPDTRGRASLGSGTGSGLTARTLGDMTIGAETMPVHSHVMYVDNDGDAVASNNAQHLSRRDGTGDPKAYEMTYLNSDPTGTHTIGKTASTGTGSHGVMQPSYVATKMIRY